MPKYVVRMKEIWYNEVEVEADSMEDALEDAAAAGGSYLTNNVVAQTGRGDPHFGYIDTMDKDTFDVFLDGELIS